MIEARIAFFCWSVFGPCLSAIQSVVVSSMIRWMPARASGEYGVVARNSAHDWLPCLARTRWSWPQSWRGNRSIGRRPKLLGICELTSSGKVSSVVPTPQNLSIFSAGAPYEPGMSWRGPPASLSHAPMLSRFTVPPLRSSITSAPPSGMWNSLRCEWPPKSGSGSISRIRESLPKRSWYHLAAARPLAPAPTITRS